MTDMTRRQRCILILMAQGLSYEKIADRMYLSKRTVERDVEKAARTLGVSNHVAIGVKAYAAGILHEKHLLGRRSDDRR